MITQLEVKNFRNIENSIWYFDSNKSIFTGRNGIGKSNTLNAMMWLFTGTLLTDNYGVGENDINSIVPNTYKKGQHTEVSIWTDAGTKFTKRYKCTFQRGTDRVNGHTTELLINDVLQSKISDFEEHLWKAFDYVPAFKTKDVKELNLFIDPLYALQKLEAEKLRKLLVAIGCSVENEEVEGYEEIKSISDKYLGDLDKAAADYKKQALAIEKELKSLDSKLETVANVEEFDDSTLNSLNAKKEKLIQEKLNLKNPEVESLVRDLNFKIQTLILEKDNNNQKIFNDTNLKLSTLREEIKIENKRIEFEVSKRTEGVREEIKRISSDIEANQSQIDMYMKYVNKYDKDIENQIVIAKKNRQAKNDYSIKLAAIQTSQYNVYIKCPHCGESFPASESDLERFNKNKQFQIESYRQSIQECINKDTSLKEIIMNLTKERDAASHEATSLRTTNNTLNNTLILKKQELNKLLSEPVDSSKVELLIKEEKELSTKLMSLPLAHTELDIQIAKLEAEKSSIINDATEGIKLQKRAIEEDLLDLEDDLSKEYINKAKWAEKKQFEEEYNNNVKKLNDIESTRGLIVEFIQRRIRLLNERAYLKTGIKFVMAEANLGDGTIKEQTVCYATVEGIPFKDVNTAKKIEVGVNFINTLKQIAIRDFNVGYNLFPVLTDKLECFDTLEKIANLNTTQLIATRVSEMDMKLICL